VADCHPALLFSIGGIKRGKNIENNYSSFFFLLKTREIIGLHACPLVQAQKYTSGATLFLFSSYFKRHESLHLRISNFIIFFSSRDE
jgi:hypothetical protein